MANLWLNKNGENLSITLWALHFSNDTTLFEFHTMDSKRFTGLHVKDSNFFDQKN